MIRAPRLRLLLILFSILSSQSVHATLGQGEDSIDKDRKTMSGIRHLPVNHSSYTIHEISNGGMTLKEFVSANGTVFAVSWKGINHPDLTPILGSFMEEYSSAHLRMERPRGRQAHSMVQSSNIVVEKFGHMRGAQGKAYIPAMLPEGISANEIH